MLDRWIEIHDGTILSLNNIVKIFTLDGKWILFDTSGHCTDISENDRKRIIELLNKNSCIQLLTNQKNNPERENIEHEKEYVPSGWTEQYKSIYILKSSLIKKVKQKMDYSRLCQNIDKDCAFHRGIEAGMDWLLEEIEGAEGEGKND